MPSTCRPALRRFRKGLLELIYGRVYLWGQLDFKLFDEGGFIVGRLRGVHLLVLVAVKWLAVLTFLEIRALLTISNILGRFLLKNDVFIHDWLVYYVNLWFSRFGYFLDLGFRYFVIRFLDRFCRRHGHFAVFWKVAVNGMICILNCPIWLIWPIGSALIQMNWLTHRELRNAMVLLNEWFSDELASALTEIYFWIL